MKTGLAVTTLLTAGYIAFRSGSDRRCILPEPMAEFDAERYYGRWYEIVRDSRAVFEYGDCIWADYGARDDEHLNVVNTKYDVDTEEFV
eukprot:CAMPEP_0176353128 /NCGR_PEP_ID=MMETSP0126-20121128/11559_1 /TAXON_ID=141414 ORGANISM="Strombidinopsis acuminatum, Strain SPMC142" /NCGR_SAMPLE_ID=MMETSP0126 /ASSEMBLY_ACC=CAM_ASM_000229 /LENGTH=88 /DNA_ID=CAMNT_0017704617 /DNA_START=35 /DNA_END=301 /DNA_ORIENTATION=+